jgi:hypothetical protein
LRNLTLGFGVNKVRGADFRPRSAYDVLTRWVSPTCAPLVRGAGHRSAMSLPAKKKPRLTRAGVAKGAYAARCQSRTWGDLARDAETRIDGVSHISFIGDSTIHGENLTPSVQTMPLPILKEKEAGLVCAGGTDPTGAVEV